MTIVTKSTTLKKKKEYINAICAYELYRETTKHYYYNRYIRYNGKKCLMK